MSSPVPVLSLSLRYFVMVARTGSISESARQLHVAASAVSRQVALLEEQLGVRLFDRVARGMRPTPAAHRLLAELAKLTDQTQHVLAELSGQAGQGMVRLACTEGFAVGVGTAVVSEYRARFAQGQCQLRVVAPDEVNRLLRQGEVDLGLKYSTSPEDGVTELRSLVAPVMAVMQPQHPLASARGVSVRDVVAYPLVLGPRTTTSRQLFDLACGLQGLRYVPTVESNHSAALLAALGPLDVLPAGYLTVAHPVAQGQLMVVPFAEPELQQRRLCLLAPSDGPRRPSVQALVDLLVAWMSRYGARKVRLPRR